MTKTLDRQRIAMILHECPSCEVELPDDTDDGKPRSYVHHKHFHAMVRSAHFHWPDIHPVQHSDWIECRNWLLVRAGHGTLKGSVPVSGVSPDVVRMLAQQFYRLADAKAVTIVRGAEIKVVVPKSIKFAACTHDEFCAISEKVRIDIENICGGEMDELLSTTPTPPKRRMVADQAAAVSAAIAEFPGAQIVPYMDCAD